MIWFDNIPYFLLSETKNVDVCGDGGMKILRDVELCRKILLVIEKKYVDTAIFNLKFEGCYMEKICLRYKICRDLCTLLHLQLMYMLG